MIKKEWKIGFKYTEIYSNKLIKDTIKKIS